MREACCLWLSAADRARLAVIAADRNSPQKHVWRAQIVLLSADRLGTVEIMRRTGKAKPSVWRWRARYLEAGVEGLLRDKTRKPGKAPVPAATVAKVLALPCSEPPGQATYWTGSLTNPAAGLDAMTFDAFVDEFGKGTDTKDGQTRIGPLGSGNFLLIGAHKPMDLPDTEADYFLLQTLTAAMPAVPAPTSLVLFASGLALMAGLRIRRLTRH